MPDTLKLVLAQLNFIVGDVNGNATRIVDTARQAHSEGCDLVVFPELALTGYPPEDLVLRRAFMDAVERELQRICEQAPDAALVVGHPQRDGEDLYNAVSFIDGGKVTARYRKRLLPNYSVFDEKRYFQAGSTPCVIELSGTTVAITICEDIWESGPVEQAVEAGARLVINVNASPYHIDRAEERLTVVGERARRCGVPVAYLNLVGGQDELVFDGASFVVDAKGKLTQRAAHCREELMTVTVDLAPSPTPRPGSIETNEELETQVYAALVTGVGDYVNKNGFKGAVVGLSGGIDSALTLAIAVDALGPERVTAVLMPSRYTAEMSVEDARSEAEALGVGYHEISIEPMYKAFTKQLAPVFGDRPADTTEENIQARCRGVLMMAISNKAGSIVLTTGNKSEMAVGYATLYGDMAGGFAAIKDVPKTLVYRIAGYRNNLSAVIPERVFQRPPSAELAPDQKDIDSLPPYEILDPILERYIEQDRSPEEIIKDGFNRDVVYRVTRMVDRNEYKRRQAPPGVRITRRAFGRDRRYPITSGYRPD